MKQLSKEWFEQRANRVTGSLAGALLGINPNMSKVEALKILHRTAEESITHSDSDNPALEWGRRMENEALISFHLDTRLYVEDCGFYPVGDWLGASPDGLIPSENAVLEIKCPYSLRNDPNPKFKTIAEQEHYYLQMQLEMLCTGMTKAYFYQWAPHGQSLEIVEKNDKYIDKRLSELLAIWVQHTVRPRAVLSTMISEYQSLQEQIKSMQERQKALLNDIVTECNGVDTIVNNVPVRKVERKGSISYAKVIKDHLPDVDLEPYRGASTEYWRIG